MGDAIGAGTALFVAPLTVTLLSSVDGANAGLTSGVNNAAAWASGLVAVAGLPLLIGMGPDTYRSDTYRSGTAFDASFNRAMPLCAALLGTGALLAFATLRQTAAVPHRMHWRAHGWLMEPPLAPRFSHHAGT
jgi:hypothetical protein